MTKFVLHVAAEHSLGSTTLWADGLYQSHVNREQEPISSRPVKPEVTFTQASEDNDWKFSMNLTYDFSENPNKEAVSDYFNNLTSDTIDPMPKKL